MGKFNICLCICILVMAYIYDEYVAKNSPCTCYAYDGEFICWSPGCIGTLSDRQERLYCNPRVVRGEVPQTVKRRWRKFSSIAEYCSALVEDYPEGEKLVPYLRCVSEELKKHGMGE